MNLIKACKTKIEKSKNDFLNRRFDKVQTELMEKLDEFMDGGVMGITLTFRKNGKSELISKTLTFGNESQTPRAFQENKKPEIKTQGNASAIIIVIMIVAFVVIFIHRGYNVFLM